MTDGFDGWRTASRELLQEGLPPEAVAFSEAGAAQRSLFGALDGAAPPLSPVHSVRVSKTFVSLARLASFHRDGDRWDLLYRLLWRLTHGAPSLLQDAVDADVARLRAMAKEVRRDAHKMHAFVRFRRVETEDGEHFIAWHRPDHLIVRHVADFFRDRFRGMRWTILTPDESVSWDGARLEFHEGVPRSEAPSGDELEGLWKAYYRSIFNPARIKLKAMQAEMPQKHWATMPETEIIGELLREAPHRVRAMVDAQHETASGFVPDGADLNALRRAVRECEACGLCEQANGPVFGEGLDDAEIVLVGEQPGDREDLEGRPFVGPAGEILDRALELAGVSREALYLTNAVKAFKHEERPEMRLHKKPTAYEIQVCKPWLAAELRAVRPTTVVALGGSAALALSGRKIPVTKERGWGRSPFAERTLITVHPASVLRATGSRQQAAFDAFVDDLRLLSQT